MQQPETRKPETAYDINAYDRHAPAILAYICRHIFDVQDAVDLLAEVFLASLKQPGFSQLAPEHQYAWLLRVAHNKTVDRVRHQSRLTLVKLDSILDYESSEQTPEQQSIEKERYATLHRAIARLKPEQQMVLQLRYAEGLRLVEIAERLHKPDSTIRNTLRRALQHLRTLYDQLSEGKEKR